MLCATQLLAHSLGGRTGRNPSGRFVLQIEEIKVLPALRTHLPDTFQARACGHADALFGSAASDYIHQFAGSLAHSHQDSTRALLPASCSSNPVSRVLG
jgi:hypothetical protein